MLRRASVLLLSVLFVSTTAGGQQTIPSAAASQEILEILAEPLPATTFKEPLHKLFAEWTEQQKQTISHQIAGRCLVTWTMMNDSGRVHLLPAALGAETSQLVLAVCVSGKMPADWPGRAAMLSNAAQILERSTSFGMALHLPPSLAQ